MAAPRITLDQWRALLAVVNEGSYARAAKALHKSQSSVTYAVQKLESLLGVKAFKVQGRKAGLTPTGELLYRRARYLLDEAMGLEQAAKKLSAGWEAEIHVAVETIFPTWLLLGCLARLGAESPHTRVELIETVLGGRDDTLLQSQAELAIFGTIPQGFMGESLMRVRFILAAHPDHQLHRLGRKLSIKALRLREGGERYAELYLIFTDREHAGPATLRLAEIIREAVASECKRSDAPAKDPTRKRVRNRIKVRSS